MCLYGDLAYPLRVHLQTPFHHLPLTPLMEEYNASMSEVRAAVEWLFGDIINSFKFLDFKKNLKIGLSSIGKMYVVCALLRNAKTCLSIHHSHNFLVIELHVVVLPPMLLTYEIAVVWSIIALI